jgi:hypothetical protein
VNDKTPTIGKCLPGIKKNLAGPFDIFVKNIIMTP